MNGPNIRSSRDASPRALSCSAATTTSTSVISLVSQNPASFSIFTLIQTVVSVTFTCTETEKVALKAVSASVDKAVTMISLEVEHLQTTLICKLFLGWN